MVKKTDMVIHLGDYIYEYAGVDNRVRKHLGQEIVLRIIANDILNTD